jgi:hypothetical protein
MTDLEAINDKLDDVLEELAGLKAVIREIHGTKPLPPPTTLNSPMQPESDSAATINLPQPDRIDRNAAAYVLKFGKHKGLKLADVPHGYLYWLVTKTWNKVPDGDRLYPEDQHCLNAARTLWHERQRTLQTPEQRSAQPDIREPAKRSANREPNPSDTPPQADEDCPF